MFNIIGSTLCETLRYEITSQASTVPLSAFLSFSLSFYKKSPMNCGTQVWIPDNSLHFRRFCVCQGGKEARQWQRTIHWLKVCFFYKLHSVPDLF